MTWEMCPTGFGVLFPYGGSFEYSKWLADRFELPSNGALIGIGFAYLYGLTLRV